MAPYSKSPLRVIRTILAIVVWISVVPVVHATPLAVTFYGGVAALAMGSFTLVHRVLARRRDGGQLTAHHRRIQIANLVSTILYAASVPLAFVSVWIALAIFMAIPILYFVADWGLEKRSSSVATASPD